MMNKEAQEKISTILWRSGIKSRHEKVSKVLEAIEELGYRKLPKDKPPLLGDRLIGIWERFDPEKPVPLLDMLQEIAKAQWNEWNKAIYGQSNLHIETQADRNDEIDRLAWYEKSRSSPKGSRY